MALASALFASWKSSKRPGVHNLVIDEEGVHLGKTLLAPFIGDQLHIDTERLRSMLNAAYRVPVPPNTVSGFRRAEKSWRAGQKALAQMHLALTGLPPADLENAQRLFACDWALSRGVAPGELLKLAGLRKDDEDEDDPEEDADGGDDDSGDVGDGSSHYNPDEPRIPAGQPGAGQWTTAGNGVSLDRGGISADEARDRRSIEELVHNENADESYGLDAVIGLAGGIAATEALSSDALAALAARANGLLSSIRAETAGMGAVAAAKAQELYDSISNAIDNWWSNVTEKVSDAFNTQSAPIPGFSVTESQIINEAHTILDSPEFSKLQMAYQAGQSVTVNIGGRVIQYVPGMPVSYSGMTAFEDNGFYIGPYAFSSQQELQQTVLHELYRLYTSQSAKGISGELAAQEAEAAGSFASRALKEIKR